MALLILRCAFVVVAMGVATALVRAFVGEASSTWQPWLIFVGTLGLALATIGVNIAFPRKQIDIISSVYVGLLVGVLLTYVISIALTPLFEAPDAKVLWPIRLLLGMVLCYSCVSLLMQTKDDFRFIIPYVEFAKEVKGLRPCVLDTSVVIDGRIADLVETSVLDGQLLLPRFALQELQGIADSSDKLRRARGRRGLDVLNRLRNNAHVDFKIYDVETPEMIGQAVDMKIVLLAKHLEGKVITGDFNLNKVAKIHNVPVINLNDIANSLKPVVLPGESVDVRVIKPGEEMGQGVGYLDDGTMIVIEGGREHLGKLVKISVTSVLQTSAGRMIFGRLLAA